MTYLTAEMFKIKVGIEMAYVVYRGGTPTLIDLIVGHILMTFAALGQTLPQYKAKQLKALGIYCAKRCPSVSEIPTLAISWLRLNWSAPCRTNWTNLSAARWTDGRR
jgi:tripartite-type tricarboxylate transporter receptor subunit TctC